jgi:anti-sigma B factor antagonist
MACRIKEVMRDRNPAPTGGAGESRCAIPRVRDGVPAAWRAARRIAWATIQGYTVRFVEPDPASRAMPLTFETTVIQNKVAVIRCKGRITFGPEAEVLETEVGRQTKVAGSNLYQLTMVVLHLGETEFIDSTGLGAIVRLSNVLRAAGGGLKLCQMQPNVLRVIETTGLSRLFPPYSSEAEAIKAFSRTEQSGEGQPGAPGAGIVCMDPSMDLLAGLNALLTRSGYEVFTTRYVGGAVTLAKATSARIVILGPGMINVPTAPEILEKLKQAGGSIKVLQLASDFHTAEAGGAGQDLLSQVRALLAAS